MFAPHAYFRFAIWLGWILSAQFAVSAMIVLVSLCTVALYGLVRSYHTCLSYFD